MNLYSSGDVTIPKSMTFTLDSDLNGESPQFTLTCTSIGGPATTVTWTRDSEAVSGGMTVLDDPVTAQYTHTLTVTGRLDGQYQCIVSNNKPSYDSASLTVQGKREYEERAREGECICHLFICVYTSKWYFPMGSERLGTESRIWGTVGLEVVEQLYVLICFSFLQWPRLPLTSWQSRKVSLASESVGPHPLHWGIQLGTRSTIVVAAVAVWMLVMAPQTTTY